MLLDLRAAQCALVASSSPRELPRNVALVAPSSPPPSRCRRPYCRAGSTQMTITSAEGAEFAAALGIDRVVVGRELSAREIGKVQQGEAKKGGREDRRSRGEKGGEREGKEREAANGDLRRMKKQPSALMADGNWC